MTRKQGTVGRRYDSIWERLYAVALGAVVIGAIAVVGVTAAAMVGDDDPAGNVRLGLRPDNEDGTATAEASTSDVTPDPETPEPTQIATEDQPAAVACGDILAPVDKAHVLPEGCEPTDLVELPPEVSHDGIQRLRAEAATAFIALVDAARSDGFELVAISAYRSYEDQVAAYQSNIEQFGQEYADRTSAKPGRSEHQLGTTVDVSSATAGYGLESIEGTPDAAWIAENSWRYGFIVSYPEGKEHITGYAYEPWHIRYVGREIAAEVQASGLTLHEYLLR